MATVTRVRADGSLSVALLCEDKSLTKQADAESCDINRIMAKYEKSGVLTHVALNSGFYADVSAVPDYQKAFDIVASADTLFASLPADIRARFDNNPGLYLDFVSDPANKDELIKMGILEVPKEPVVVPVDKPA